jgi:hypothetical protein
MIDWNKIKKHEETIKKNNEKLNLEKDFKKREKLKMLNDILILKIKIEKLK